MSASRSRGTEAEELNLVPIMNLVTILIPFLLMAAEFVSYAVIESVLPAIGEVAPPTDDAPLNLRIEVGPESLRIVGDDPGLRDGVVVEAGPDGLDVARLRTLLGSAKDRRPEERAVTLVPEAGVRYARIVEVMDATREDPSVAGSPGEGCLGRCLFPAVVIAGGAR